MFKENYLWFTRYKASIFKHCFKNTSTVQLQNTKKHLLLNILYMHSMQNSSQPLDDLYLVLLTNNSQSYKLFEVTCSIFSSSSRLSSSICFFLLSRALMSLSNFITLLRLSSMSLSRFWKYMNQIINECHNHNIQNCLWILTSSGSIWLSMRWTVSLEEASWPSLVDSSSLISWALSLFCLRYLSSIWQDLTVFACFNLSCRKVSNTLMYLQANYVVMTIRH